MNLILETDTSLGRLLPLLLRLKENEFELCTGFGSLYERVNRLPTVEDDLIIHLDQVIPEEILILRKRCTGRIFGWSEVGFILTEWRINGLCSKVVPYQKLLDDGKDALVLDTKRNL